jgi:hypothetical protein
LPIWPRLWRNRFLAFLRTEARSSQGRAWLGFKRSRYPGYRRFFPHRHHSLSVYNRISALTHPFNSESSQEQSTSSWTRLSQSLGSRWFGSGFTKPQIPQQSYRRSRRYEKYIRRLARRHLNKERKRLLFGYLRSLKIYIYKLFFHPRERVKRFRFYQYNSYRTLVVSKQQRLSWLNWVKHILKLRTQNPRKFIRFDRWRLKTLARKRFMSRYPVVWSKRLVYFYMTQTSNNFFYSFFSRRRLLASYSNGRTEFFGSRRRSSVACESAIKHVARTFNLFKLFRIFVVFSKRINFFSRTVLRILARYKFKIMGCTHLLRVPHGFPLRKRASRRV